MMKYTTNCENNLRICYDIPFATVNNRYGKPQTLGFDLYAPQDTSAPRRTLILLHGGGFLNKPGCDKQQFYIVTLCMALARCGYVCVSPDYCLYDVPDFDAPDFDKEAFRASMGDAAVAAAGEVELCRQYLLAHAEELGVDKNNIGIMGGSAGGFTANIACQTEGAYRCFVCLWGAARDTSLQNLEKYVPTLIVHGTDDQAVPFVKAQELYAGLQQAGIPVKFIPLEGAQHTPIHRLPEYFDAMLTLFDENMV